MIGTVIYQALKEDAEIAALLGGPDSPRIYPNIPAQDVQTPWIAYRFVGISSIGCQDGSVHKNDRLMVLTADLSPDTAAAISDLIVQRLNFYSGTVGNDTVEFCTFESDSDDLLEDTRLFAREAVFKVLSTITKN